jgi:hypothetical protein
LADLQSTNRTALAKVRESTFGVTPDNPAFKAIRNTSSSLNANPQTVITNEIRSDRQVTDLILVGQQASGDVGGELSFEAFDDDFEEALQGTWDNQPYIEVLTEDTEISAVSTTTLTVASGGAAFVDGMLCSIEGMPTSANNKLARVSSSTGTTIVFPAATFTAESDPIPVGASVRVVGFQGASGDLVATVTGGNAITSTALDFTTLDLEVGDWVKVGGTAAGDQFTNDTDNNGWCRVSEIAAQRLDFDVVPSGWGADAGTGKTLQVFHGDRLRNASTKRSNTFERQYLDHSPTTYEYFRGMTLNTMSVAFSSQSIVTVTKAYMGKDAIMPDPMGRLSGATDVAAPTYDVMNTSSNVGDLSVGGVTVTGPNFVMSATIEINNNLRQQNAIRSIGAVGIGNGELTINVTGLETYFGNPEIYRSVLDNDRTSLSLRVVDPDGFNPAYVFDLPAIKFQTGAPAVSGKNADVLLSGSAQAIMHPTLGYTMGINRLHYTP